MASDDESGESRWEELIEADAHGSITTEEARELELLAQTDPVFERELAALRGMSDAFVEPDVTDSDHALIEQLVAQRHGGRRRRSQKKLLLAAALTILPLAAAATILPGMLAEDPRATEAPDAHDEGPSQKPGSDATALGSDQETETPPPIDATSEEPPAAEGEPSEEPVPASPQKENPSPGQLLTRAQEARASGSYGQALGAYRRLLRAHPSSPEARLAHISLAQLLLARGDPAGALAEFSAYETAGGGSHSREALFGKIEALHALGRSAEERAAIDLFLHRYPRSAQAASVRARLGRGDAAQ